ncbi:MAG: NAD-dependent epimerase/dehydratase family protein [Opitutaceae bacterium]
MTSDLFIAGCGYVGAAVARLALERGVRVTALTRNPVRAAALRELGVKVVVADLASDAWHREVPAAPRWVVNCVSSSGGGVDGYRKSYVEGTTSLVRWVENAGGTDALLYTGSTSVYPQGAGERVDETSPVGAADERGALLLEAERLVQEAARAARRRFVLRLAGIYGPSRHHWLEQVRTGEVSGGGEHRLNLIHRDDAAAAILACLSSELGPGAHVFNVADDAPTPKAEVAAWLAQRMALPRPQFTGVAHPARCAVVPDRVIVNAALRRETGWRPSFPTFREGYESILSRGTDAAQSGAAIT